MPQTDFSEIFKQLKDEVVELVKTTLGDFVKEGKKDAIQFLESSEEKLKRWTDLLAKGDLTTDDFQWLVKSQKDLLEMTALKKAGLTAIKINEFKNKLLNLMINTITGIIGV